MSHPRPGAWVGLGRRIVSTTFTYCVSITLWVVPASFVGVACFTLPMSTLSNWMVMELLQEGETAVSPYKWVTNHIRQMDIRPFYIFFLTRGVVYGCVCAGFFGHVVHAALRPDERCLFRILVIAEIIVFVAACAGVCGMDLAAALGFWPYGSWAAIGVRLVVALLSWCPVHLYFFLVLCPRDRRLYMFMILVWMVTSANTAYYTWILICENYFSLQSVVQRILIGTVGVHILASIIFETFAFVARELSKHRGTACAAALLAIPIAWRINVCAIVSLASPDIVTGTCMEIVSGALELRFHYGLLRGQTPGQNLWNQLRNCGQFLNWVRRRTAPETRPFSAVVPQSAPVPALVAWSAPEHAAVVEDHGQVLASSCERDDIPHIASSVNTSSNVSPHPSSSIEYARDVCLQSGMTETPSPIDSPMCRTLTSRRSMQNTTSLFQMVKASVSSFMSENYIDAEDPELRWRNILIDSVRLQNVSELLVHILVASFFLLNDVNPNRPNASSIPRDQVLQLFALKFCMELATDLVAAFAHERHGAELDGRSAMTKDVSCVKRKSLLVMCLITVVWIADTQMLFLDTLCVWKPESVADESERRELSSLGLCA